MDSIHFQEECFTEDKKLKGKIRFAEKNDAEEILKIYAPYIENTSITFEYDVPTVEEFSKRIEEITKHYPWIVYEEDGEILGYAYGSPQYTRAAYQWTVESSVYVAEGAKGKGIGKKLYSTLFDILKAQNFCLCYAIIIEENEISIKMHETFGFIKTGFSKNSGYKLGAWHSIVTMEKQLNEFSVPPKPVIPITEMNFEF